MTTAPTLSTEVTYWTPQRVMTSDTDFQSIDFGTFDSRSGTLQDAQIEFVLVSFVQSLVPSLPGGFFTSFLNVTVAAVFQPETPLTGVPQTSVTDVGFDSALMTGGVAATLSALTEETSAPLSVQNLSDVTDGDDITVVLGMSGLVSVTTAGLANESAVNDQRLLAGVTVTYTYSAIEYNDLANSVSGDESGAYVNLAGGDDWINAGAGDDTIIGGPGNDRIIGGDGMDTVDYRTATGDVTVDLRYTNRDVGGGQGRDNLSSIENITGSEFDDRLVGDNNDNVLLGNGGADVLKSFDGNDTAKGGAGNDMIMLGDGDNTAEGNTGNDQFYTGSGADTLNGGAGNDYFNTGAGDDIVTAGNGTNQMTLGAGNDSATGGTGRDVMKGRAGDDTLDGGEGNNKLQGDDGNDRLTTGAGTDVLSGGAGNDSLSAGAGDDFLFGGRDNDILDGGTGNDVLRGNRGNDNMLGGDGDDVLHGGGGDDNTQGGTGNDWIAGGNGSDILRGGEGDDTLVGGTSANGGGDGVQDIFVFGRVLFDEGGIDRVKDFEVGIDKIDLSLSSINFFDHWFLLDVTATISQVGSDVLLTTAADEVLIIENTIVSDFTEGDFIF